MTIANTPSKQYRSSRCVRSSHSTVQQERTELEVSPYFVDLATLPQSQLDFLIETGLIEGRDALEIRLLRDNHIDYISTCWNDEKPLRASFVSLDASRTWIMYWTLHSADLLGHQVSPQQSKHLVETLRKCFFRNASFGGFGGGPGQMPHAATTYGAVLALCILSKYEPSALELLKEVRPKLYPWLLSLKQPDGSFRMQHDGEIDVRATYCVMTIATLLNMVTPELRQGADDHVASCQTWEGGFGAEPFSEAHGGYTFCALAALYLLDGFHKIDTDAMLGWLTRRQMGYEGGFCGRTNKLVDGCYSFWQGGALAIASIMANASNCKIDLQDDPWLSGSYSTNSLLFDRAMLQRYILLCAQDFHGGLRDKPSAHRDFYHSCYNLSGLSVSQHCDKHATSFGHPQATIEATHPVYNIRLDKVQLILEHFRSAPAISSGDHSTAPKP